MINMSNNIDTDKFVIDYLLAKGYNKAATELIHEKESNIDNQVINNDLMNQETSHDKNDQNLINHSSDSHNNNTFENLILFGIYSGNSKVYLDEYEVLQRWAIDSLDLIKEELLSICFPVFVHR